MSLASSIAIVMYFIIGSCFALYIVGFHLLATWKYIKQLYTARYLTPTKIKTCFGFDYWWDYDNDPWFEVIFMTTLIAIIISSISIFLWPLSSLFLINKSIQNARRRLDN